ARELAKRTGGEYWNLWDAFEIPNAIEDERQIVTTADDPIPLWDTWFSLYLLAGLLTAEWILRKWFRLL
ncbi:MAG: hypothetical protein AAF517_20505, partial [Planctomycetota bacterium]